MEYKYRSIDPNKQTSLYLDVIALISAYGFENVKQFVSEIRKEDLLDPSNMEGDD